MNLVASLAAVPLLILMNAFFVAAEYAIVAIRNSQVEAMRVRGRRRAAEAMAALRADSAGSIGAIQLCITLTNLLLGWVGEPAMSRVLLALLGPLASALPETLFTVISTTLSFGVVTLLTVVLSELLPKALTLRYAQPVAVLTAVPVLLIRRVTAPLVILMNAIANLVTQPLGLGRVEEMEKEEHTAEEIVHITTEAAASGTLSPRERSLVVNSLSVARQSARTVMVPRTRVTYLDVRCSMGENRERMSGRLFSRLPLCDGSLDKVLGVVAVKEFLAAEQATDDAHVLLLLAQRPVFLPGNARVEGLMAAFAEHGTQMVFLVDEYGGVQGIVTPRDLLNRLVTELPREALAAPDAPDAPSAPDAATPAVASLHA